MTNVYTNKVFGQADAPDAIASESSYLDFYAIFLHVVLSFLAYNIPLSLLQLQQL
jgi:hypothetical protein